MYSFFKSISPKHINTTTFFMTGNWLYIGDKKKSQESAVRIDYIIVHESSLLFFYFFLQMEKQSDRQTDRQTDRQINKQTNKHTNKLKERQRDKQTHIQAHRQTDTGRQNDTQIDRDKHTSLTYLTMAEAMGCSLEVSAVPTMARNLMKEHTDSLTNVDTRDTRGTPWVSVPVLSNTMVWSWSERKKQIRFKNVYLIMSQPPLNLTITFVNENVLLVAKFKKKEKKRKLPIIS